MRQKPLGTNKRRKKSRFSTLLFKGGGVRGVFSSSLSVMSTKQLLPVLVACYIHANCQEVLDPGKGK